MDLIEIAGKATLSIITIGVSLIVSIWDTVKSNNLTKRQEEWKITVESRLSQLEADLDDIGNNDNFTTCLLKTIELAMKTSLDKK